MNCTVTSANIFSGQYGGYFANFSSSVGSISEEIYSQQAVYLSYTSRHTSPLKLQPHTLILDLRLHGIYRDLIAANRTTRTFG